MIYNLHQLQSSLADRSISVDLLHNRSLHRQEEAYPIEQTWLNNQIKDMRSATAGEVHVSNSSCDKNRQGNTALFGCTKDIFNKKKFSMKNIFQGKHNYQLVFPLFGSSQES